MMDQNQGTMRGMMTADRHDAVEVMVMFTAPSPDGTRATLSLCEHTWCSVCLQQHCIKQTHSSSPNINSYQMGKGGILGAGKVQKGIQ